MNDRNHSNTPKKRLDLFSLDKKGNSLKTVETKKDYFMNKKSEPNFVKSNFFNQSIEKYMNTKKLIVDKENSLNNPIKHKIISKTGKDLIKMNKDIPPYDLPFKPNLNIKSNWKKNKNETCDKSPNTSSFEIKNNLENYLVGSRKLRNKSVGLTGNNHSNHIELILAYNYTNNNALNKSCHNTSVLQNLKLKNVNANYNKQCHHPTSIKNYNSRNKSVDIKRNLSELKHKDLYGSRIEL